MADVRFARVTSAQLASTAIIDGQLLFCTDTNKIYLDSGNVRIPYSASPANNDFNNVIGIASPTENDYVGAGAIKTMYNTLNTNNGALNSQHAPQYSSAQTWAVGDYCTKDNFLYRCKTAISTPEPFNGNKWDLVTVGGELKSLNNKIETNNSTLSNSISMLGLRTTTLETSLDGVKGGASNITFSIGADGKPYINYKVGADTVSKKLGSSEISLVAQLPTRDYGGHHEPTGNAFGYAVPSTPASAYLAVCANSTLGGAVGVSASGGGGGFVTVDYTVFTSHTSDFCSVGGVFLCANPVAGTTISVNCGQGGVYGALFAIN